MALEFRPRDETYKGPRRLPCGAQIPQARVFVDHLPPGFDADPYGPYLVKDRYSYRPRYVIDSRIVVYDYIIALAAITPRGPVYTKAHLVQLIANATIEQDGLEILLVHRGREYQGTLCPITVIDEADQ